MEITLRQSQLVHVVCIFSPSLSSSFLFLNRLAHIERSLWFPLLNHFVRSTTPLNKTLCTSFSIDPLRVFGSWSLSPYKSFQTSKQTKTTYLPKLPTLLVCFLSVSSSLCLSPLQVFYLDVLTSLTSSLRPSRSLETTVVLYSRRSHSVSALHTPSTFGDFQITRVSSGFAPLLAFSLRLPPFSPWYIKSNLGLCTN